MVTELSFAHDYPSLLLSNSSKKTQQLYSRFATEVFNIFFSFLFFSSKKTQHPNIAIQYQHKSTYQEHIEHDTINPSKEKLNKTCPLRDLHMLIYIESRLYLNKKTLT